MSNSDDTESERRQRAEMVDRYLREEIHDQRVINAFLKVPRHLFIDEENRQYAYENRPVPIGEGD